MRDISIIFELRWKHELAQANQTSKFRTPLNIQPFHSCFSSSWTQHSFTCWSKKLVFYFFLPSHEHFSFLLSTIYSLPLMQLSSESLQNISLFSWIITTSLIHVSTDGSRFLSPGIYCLDLVINFSFVTLLNSCYPSHSVLKFLIYLMLYIYGKLSDILICESLRSVHVKASSIHVPSSVKGWQICCAEVCLM